MTTKQFNLFREESHYISHLEKIQKEASNVCNRINCSKHSTAMDDMDEINSLLLILISKTKERMDVI